MNILRIQLEKTNQVWWFRWWLGDSKWLSNTKTAKISSTRNFPPDSLNRIDWMISPTPKETTSNVGRGAKRRILDPVVVGFSWPTVGPHKGPQGKPVGKNPQTLRGLMWELCKKLWKRLSRPELSSNKKMGKHTVTFGRLSTHFVFWWHLVLVLLPAFQS